MEPMRHRQLMELDMVTLCTDILLNARNELYLNMKYFDIALSSLGFEAQQSSGLRTDGINIYYNPEYLCSMYKAGRIYVNRAYLHIMLHCLFCHLDGRKNRAKEYWDLSCDIAVESIIDSLYQKCVHIASSWYRRETYQRLNEKVKVMNAESIYKALHDMALTENQYKKMVSEFYRDSHELWEQTDSPKIPQQRQNKWKDNREKMQTNMETFSKETSENSKNLLEQVQIENKERYDYKQFLRRFSVLKEEMHIDTDSFDYAFYTYGLSLYGNMPLIEPLESKEIHRIEDFVIVIDTSMSCSGELVQRFLEETYNVLSEAESYFRKINVHIIQCDDKVQSDTVITSGDEMEQYMQSFTVTGQGGTDFRPAFEYVNQLRLQHRFKKLRGLIYFTDGKGIYPVKMPPYEAAFVFIEDKYFDEAVPAWAVKVVLTEEDLIENKGV